MCWRQRTGSWSNCLRTTYNDRVPRHFGKLEQPINSAPPLRAVLRTIALPHLGQSIAKTDEAESDATGSTRSGDLPVTWLISRTIASKRRPSISSIGWFFAKAIASFVKVPVVTTMAPAARWAATTPKISRTVMTETVETRYCLH